MRGITQATISSVSVSSRCKRELHTCFFERTTLDECVSINIEEKYKIIFMGDHNQTRKKNHKTQNRQIRLEHQTITSRCLQERSLNRQIRGRASTTNGRSVCVPWKGKAPPKLNDFWTERLDGNFVTRRYHGLFTCRGRLGKSMSSRFKSLVSRSSVFSWCRTRQGLGWPRVRFESVSVDLEVDG